MKNDKSAWEIVMSCQYKSGFSVGHYIVIAEDIETAIGKAKEYTKDWEYEKCDIVEAKQSNFTVIE